MTLTAAPAMADQHRGGRGDRGSDRGHAVVVGPRAVYGAPHYYRPYYYRPYYARPYYAFRPHFSIGFGIWAGYPVAYPAYYAPYPYAYPAPYPYSYPPPYGYGYPSQPYPPSYPPQGYPSQGYPSQGYPSQGYPPQSYPQSSYPSYGDPGSVQVQPGGSSYGASGGVSFEITPSGAAVYVDGTYMGTADQFGPQSEPLQLSAGRHRIEIRANGLQPLAFDANIVAGQVIPYRGSLQQ